MGIITKFSLFETLSDELEILTEYELNTRLTLELSRSISYFKSSPTPFSKSKLITFYRSGANPNFAKKSGADDIFGLRRSPPIFFSAMKSLGPDGLTISINYGADLINAVDTRFNNENILFYLASNWDKMSSQVPSKRPEVCLEILKNNGMDINQKNEKGDTISHVILRDFEKLDPFETVKILTSAGIDPTIIGMGGDTLLHIIAQLPTDPMEKSGEIIDYLINNFNLDVNALDDNGMTAGHWAIIYGNNSAMDSLLRHNCDVTIKNKDGRTLHDLYLHRSVGFPELMSPEWKDIEKKLNV